VQRVRRNISFGSYAVPPAGLSSFAKMRRPIKQRVPVGIRTIEEVCRGNCPRIKKRVKNQFYSLFFLSPETCRARSPPKINFRRAGSGAGYFFLTTFFAAGFFATGFLATGFFTAAFLTATGFFATGFFAAGFFTAAFFAATGFFAAGFDTAAFFAGAAFFAAGFFAVVFKNVNAILLSFSFFSR
jgi:hypothetical protein